jgi:hypothetical protein
MIKLELSVDEVNGVLMGLSKLPYEFSAPLIEKLKTAGRPTGQPCSSSTRSRVKIGANVRRIQPVWYLVTER